MEPTQTNSLAALLQSLRDETTTLLRQEVALAKAEMTEKASHLGAKAVQVAIGGFVAYAGVIILLLGVGDLLAMLLIRAGLNADTAVWIGRVVIGVAILLIGWSMFAKAKKAMTAENLVPEQTLQSLRENKQWAQTKLHQSHESTI